ncbi:MAG: hypothetical protein ACYDBB_17910 [Armatimonadota bacterium]
MTNPSPHVIAAEVRVYRGKPTIFIDGQPTALPSYSPVTWRDGYFQRTGPGFFKHHMGAYWIGPAQEKDAKEWGESPFYNGDVPTDSPTRPFAVDMDGQAQLVLDGDPDAYFLIRNGPSVTPSWRRLHEDQIFVSEDGEMMPIPSLASDLYWQSSAEALQAVVRYCERRSWGHRIVGYWFGFDGEGTHFPLFGGYLYDHSPVMTARWRAWLQERYRSVEALREAHGDTSLTFKTIQVPKDPMRGRVPEVSAIHYWQSAKENAPLRDYLLLQKTLFLQGSRTLINAQAEATERKRVFVVDAFKQTMAGWSNHGFFNLNFDWPLTYPDPLAGTGSMGVADLFTERGFDGLVTPIDYQVRGVGGVCEPEGSVDSVVLRGKYFFAEFDTRTYNTDNENTAYGTAANAQEFAAINWRNTATALTRGFNGYWMDLNSNWFGNDDIHAVIRRTVEALKDSVEWEHADVPGIAMVIDDEAALETNGAGNFFNEAIMWEQKYGISRCGVPFRIYLLDDLMLDNFPQHRVFYFPNLFKVDDARLALLQEKVFRDGNVVLWGPGSGISDGVTLDPRHAQRLTGFTFDMLNLNHPRRTHIQRFDHPITKGLAADIIYGSTLAFGPVLYPTDGLKLGLCWAKQGKTYSGLSVKTFGNGAAGDNPAGTTLGAGDWSSVFTTSVPVPADLWRNLARYAGTHVYSKSNDILLADSSIVALHSIQSGEKCIALPGAYEVEDVISGEKLGGPLREIRFVLDAPETRVFRLMR